MSDTIFTTAPKPLPRPLVKIKAWKDRGFFGARLVYYMPDWDYRLKFRGYALVLLNPHFRLAPYLLMNPGETFFAGVVNVNEVFLHRADNVALKSYCYHHNDHNPIVFHRPVYEAWKCRMEIDRLLFQARKDEEEARRLRRLLRMSEARLWRRALSAIGEDDDQP